MENLLERVEALEHHLRTLAAHTHTVERRLRLWRRLACGLVVLLVLGLILSSSTAQEERPSAGNRSLGQRLADLEDTLRKLRSSSPMSPLRRMTRGAPRSSSVG